MAKKVMIVDDEISIIELLTMILSSSGYEVVSTVKALDSIILAHNEMPELIILDYKMPGMDGINVLKGLRASHMTKHIPIVFVTGNKTPELYQRIKENNALDIITKPFSSQEIISICEQAIGPAIELA